MKKVQKKNNNLIYLLPILALIGYFAGQFIKKELTRRDMAKIEAEVFPIIRENISNDMKLVIEPDYIVTDQESITVYLKQDTNAPGSPEATKSRDFVRQYLKSKIESWRDDSEHQGKEVIVKFNDE